MDDLRATSPLAHRHTGSPAAVTASPALTLRERPELALFRLIADVERHPALGEAVTAVFGAALPTPGRPSGDRVRAVWQGPTDTLFIGPPDAAGAAMSAIAEAVTPWPALFDELTYGLAVIDLEGPAAHIVCAPPPSGAPGTSSSVGRLADLRVTRIFDAATVRIVVERCDADYVWAWLESRLPALNSGSSSA